MRIAKKLDPEYRSIDNFVKNEAQNIKDKSLILDVAAGGRPYKKYFQHCIYSSCDYEKTMIDGRKDHDFYCSAELIPKKNEEYDVVLNTQALQNFQRPWIAISEFHRILKPGGRLIITVPFVGAVHEEPYHFFNFTEYGLKMLLEDSGFKIVKLNNRYGCFLCVAKILSLIPNFILIQYYKPKKNYLILILLSPLYILSRIIFTYIIPLICYPIDKIDKKPRITLGYSCVAEKN